MKENKLFNTKLLGLTIIATVGFGFLQGARLLDLNTGPYSPQPYALLGLTVDGCTFLAVALLSYFGLVDKARPLFRIGIAAAALYVVLALFGETNDVILILMQITAGMGWSLSLLCWMEVFTSYRPFYSLLMISAGYVINTLMPLVSNILFPDHRQIVLLIVFMLATVALYICLKNNGYIARAMQEDVAPKTSMAEAFSRTKRAVAATFAFSIVCGYIIQMDILADLQYAQSELTALLSVGVAFVMLVVLAVLKLKKANIDYICPIAAICLATILLYRSFPGSDGYLAGALMTAFLISSYVLLWLTFISEAYERKLPAFFLLGLALAVARLSVAAGRFIANEASLQFSISTEMMLPCAIWFLVASVALIFSSYLRFSTKQRDHQPDDVSEDASALPLDVPGEQTSYDPSLNDRALKELAKVFELSERESEMVGEYSAGRSARYIADYYILSEHTVKTHLRRAYAKMGIHSRQELLDLIEETESKLLRESS